MMKRKGFPLGLIIGASVGLCIYMLRPELLSETAGPIILGSFIGAGLVVLYQYFTLPPCK